MIFALHRLFTRKGFEGYGAFHHYSDVAVSAAATTVLAARALVDGDAPSAKVAFETAAYLGAVVGATASWRTAVLTEPRKAQGWGYAGKFLAGSVLAVALSSAFATFAEEGYTQQMRMATQWRLMSARQPSPLLVCAPRVSGPDRIYPVLKCDSRPFPQTIAL